MNATITPNDEPSMPSPDAAPAAAPSLGERLHRWYYALKYAAFRKERRPNDGRRGLVVLQIDALAYRDLRRAIELGYCPTLAHLVHDEGFTLRRWFSGLPSATPYCQAGIMYGENAGIPAFRFYDKPARRVITCNAPQGVQYIRDHIHAPGALAGGSSYVNLLDGDARTVAFTVATRERMSVFRRLGGTRMLLLIAMHPIRLTRMLLQAAVEWLREDVERSLGELSRQERTHAEGMFPFIRIFSNVVVRELQTLAVMLDVYLGVPVIYSTFMQYDELAHHFGPASWQAMRDLRRTDRRIGEIWRMIQVTRSRQYDLVILSDHGMTPARSYRVVFGESLGKTIQRFLRGEAEGVDAVPMRALVSFAEDSEYADAPAQVVEAVAQLSRRRHGRRRNTLRRVRDWVRSRYGLRELILPEKYLVGRENDVVITYSSPLAHLYFADDARRLLRRDIATNRRRAYLYAALLAHPGIGLVATLDEGGVVQLESARGRAVIRGDTLTTTAGNNPLEPYGTEPQVVRALADLVRQPNAGDLVLFGAYDGYSIVSFDDQVGAHGAAGGDQVYPFIIAPASLDLAHATLEDARDIHRVILSRYAARH